MNVPDDLLYTKTHEWIRREGENIRVALQVNDGSPSLALLDPPPPVATSRPSAHPSPKS